uniref:Uncharacterized protein n=1 Tax=Ursus maritimus TaxID=29073 RepID=A0A452TZR0_URSMA
MLLHHFLKHCYLDLNFELWLDILLSHWKYFEAYFILLTAANIEEYTFVFSSWIMNIKPICDHYLLDDLFKM